ncbi:MAG: sulfur oxidation c-type cytochrome SoxX [Rhodocyclaceae bacterium]|nr:sulfur oxidation c-type cytochrome SoxX [Rhodocyclaceae bacterium]
MNTSKPLLLALLFLSCAIARAEGDYRAQALAVIKHDFHDRGQATIDRLDNDAVQYVCNRYSNDPPSDLSDMLEAEQLDTVKFPADGKLLGDWKKGEKIAQSGAGFTWTDRPGLPVGGNCYNCHKISPKEISFGTMGPSLYRYGKRRGTSLSVQKDTYAQIYNAKGYKLCSPMPRFGHIGALTEEQIKDLVGLLLDPESPVNQ